MLHGGAGGVPGGDHPLVPRCPPDPHPCPENCIYSMWSEWSHCSETCIVSPSPIPWTGSYQKGGSFGQQLATNIHPGPPCEPTRLPTQQRYRIVLKKERFGGSCDIMLMARNQTGKENMLVCRFASLFLF